MFHNFQAIKPQSESFYKNISLKQTMEQTLLWAKQILCSSHSIFSATYVFIKLLLHFFGGSEGWLQYPSIQYYSLQVKF